MLTVEQKADYIINPNHCPYCDSKEIRADEPDSVDNGKAYTVSVWCLDCLRKWIDIYRLDSIKERKTNQC